MSNILHKFNLVFIPIILSANSVSGQIDDNSSKSFHEVTETYQDSSTSYANKKEIGDIGDSGGIIFQIVNTKTNYEYTEAYQFDLRQRLYHDNGVIINQFDLNGYTDWRLPSADEFLKMIKLIDLDIDVGLGGGARPYWINESANYKDHRCTENGPVPMFLVYWVGLETTYYPNGKPFKNMENWIPKCPNKKYFVRPVRSYTKQKRKP
ncbi:hypothetical protein [Gracilimonas halophila]|uniref:DUF1566 domain-containing protein n=1 Tax=Gracilimonas halophila TaxID=1834464 RepID=A0ABW5JHN7_9BACT